MKKVLLLTLVIVMAASLAYGQQGVLGLYSDATGTNCNLLDAVPGLVSYYVVQTLTSGSTACEYATPAPACLLAVYLSYSSPFGVSIGDPVTGGGNSTAYGACLAGSIHVVTLNYFAQGLTPSCCLYPVVDNQNSGQLVAVDCVPQAVPISGLVSTVNGNATCDCATLPTENATWGKVKSLYQ